MGYIRDLGSTLEEKLASLPETERASIIAFVKEAVLTSYRNGLRDAGSKNRSPRSEGERFSKSSKTSSAPDGRTSYQR